MRSLNLLLLVICIACGEDANGTLDDVPTLSPGFTEIVEGNDGTNIASITLNLDHTSSEEIIIDYSTSDGTALEGTDYLPQSGSITIPPGEQSVVIDIEIVADAHLELVEQFTLNIDNVTNAVSTTIPSIIKIIDDDAFQVEEEEDGFVTPLSYSSMTLVWNDEFEGPSLDMNNWTFDIGDGCDQGICGWGNKELQVFSNDESNIFIEEGKLVIRATEPFPTTYQSARINTKGKQQFQFGRIDIRAKLPKGQGLWPAMWMLGSNIDEVGWPRSGEIDIMELVGHVDNVVHGTAHYDAGGHQFEGSSKSLSSSETFGDKFHIYSIVWDQSGIEWYLDYKKYFRITPSDIGATYPFDNPFYFIFNVSVGGEWPGRPDETTTFPQDMIVDYVRVFR